MLTPRLRTIIADEKVRFNVNHRNHEWRVFASVAKRMEPTPLAGNIDAAQLSPAGRTKNLTDNGNAAPSSSPAGRTRNRISLLDNGNAAPSSSPAGRTRNRTSLAAGNSNMAQASSPPGRSRGRISLAASDSNAPRVLSPPGRMRDRISLAAVQVQDATPSQATAARPASLHKQAIRRVRHSDPGPFLSQGDTTTTTQKRRSIGTASGAPASRPAPTPGHRRRSIAASHSHRRHTFAVPSHRQFASPTPEAVSQEIQFFPLKHALSARTRRALRRNALSEEMNNIDEEKRAGLTKNRIELIKLRRELAESGDRLRELERELAAARHAPSEEPEPLPPINEEQADDDFGMGFVPDDDNQHQPSASPRRRSPASAEPQMDNMQVDEAPVPNPRDQKIKDLESMIESLRDDIAQRAEEERLRAQEDEVFHDAEEQIMHEEHHALAEKIEELTAIKAKKVSFDGDVEDMGAEEDDDSYMGPLADDVEEDITDTEGEHASFRSSGISSSSQAEDDVRTEKIAVLQSQNDQLRQTIESLGAKIRDIETELQETHMSVSEREKAFNKLKRDNEKSMKLEKELELKITELEEMEGERLEAVGHMMVQTDEVADQERILMEKKMDSLTEEAEKLQEMIKVVAVEKREAEARITAAGLQIESLQAAAESDEASKLEAESQVRALTTQISDLENALSDEYNKSERVINEANAQIADLQRTAEAGEAARLGAEAKILIVTSQAKELESAVFEERTEVEARIVELEAAVEAGKIAKANVETHIATLMDQIQEREVLISEVKSVSQAQITDLQALVESSEVAKANSEARIVVLTSQVEDLETSIAEQERDVKALIAAGHAQVADLQAAVEASEAAKTEAEAQIEDLKSQIEDLKEDVSDLTEDKAEIQKEMDDLRDKIEELETEIWELREENAEMRREMKILAQDGKESEDAVNILKEDKAGLETQVESLETKVEELENAAEALAEAKASLETEFVSLNAQLFTQQTAAGLAERTLETFEQNVVELRSHIEVLEQTADVSRNEKESFERDITSLRIQILSLENEQKLTGDKNHDLQQTIDELRAQISSFEQTVEAADEENQRLQNAITESNAQVEVLRNAGQVVNQQKEALEQTLASLNNQLTKLCEELDAFRAENNIFKQEIEIYKSEIMSLKWRLELSSQEKDVLHHNIQKLEDTVESLESACIDSNERSRDLQSDIESLHAEIKTLKQASVIAEEERSIIQQKIRPYIQGEQSLDMAVEEVLTELVMAKNRADENERIRTELFNKIRILAQNDGSDTESINPEEMVERLTDCFKEVRGNVEKLYESRGQIPGGPFEGYDLGDFAWTGSNESSLSILGRLVRDMCVKITSAQARAQKMQEGWEQEKEQCILYESYLEDIATTVGDKGQNLPEKTQILRVVTQRLLALKEQIEAAEEKVEELNDSVAQKSNTIKDLETNIDNSSQREMVLNQKLVNSISAHTATTTCLDKAHMDIKELGRVINEKDEKIEMLGATIEQQAVSHKTAVTKLEQEKDKAVADMEKQLADLRDAKANVEHLASQAREENILVVKTLQDIVAASKAELEETNETLKAMKTSHQEIVEQLEGYLAQGRGELSEVSRKLRETIKKSSDDILALETKLESSESEARRQKSSLAKAVAKHNSATKQFNAEILSNYNAIASLEKKVQTIQAQHEDDQKAIASLETDLRTTRNTAEEEKNALQEKIHSHVKNINELKERISELEEMVQEVEDSEKDLEDRLKATESQSQLFQEESSKAQQALEVEKATLQQNLVELRLASAAIQTNMVADITTLRSLVKEKSQRIQELETVITNLQNEKSDLEVTVDQLDDMFEIEQTKYAETVQNMANEATKFMARFGDVKNQSTKDHRLRQAEGIRNRRKRAREEQEAEENAHSMCMPPTPASSIIASTIEIAKKRDSKRRKYDSGVGVDVDEEEFEGISQVGA